MWKKKEKHFTFCNGRIYLQSWNYICSIPKMCSNGCLPSFRVACCWLQRHPVYAPKSNSLAQRVKWNSKDMLFNKLNLLLILVWLKWVECVFFSCFVGALVLHSDVQCTGQATRAKAKRCVVCIERDLSKHKWASPETVNTTQRLTWLEKKQIIDGWSMWHVQTYTLRVHKSSARQCVIYHWTIRSLSPE